MSESEFQHAITLQLALMSRRTLRVSDRADARNGVYGLRALTLPRIDSTGADLLVLPYEGLPCVLARSGAEVRAAIAEHEGGFFLELKDPHARKRSDQLEQSEWMKWVSGGRK